MADLGEIKRAPIGTEYRISGTSAWQTATKGQTLLDGYQTRNTLNADYQVELFGDAEMAFETTLTVSLSEITGTVKYKNTQDNWVTVNEEGDVAAKAVGTEPGGGVYIVCSGSSIYRPPKWD
ncbi:MAG: hypothetical protein ABIE92_08210 [bacterium]